MRYDHRYIRAWVAVVSDAYRHTGVCGGVGITSPSIKCNTGMDKTSLDTSSGSLFVILSGCPRHVERNYVPLFGMQTALHNRTLTYVIT